MEMKICNRCGTEHPKTTKFFAWKKDARKLAGGYLASYCRPCESKRRREWTLNNLERSRANNRRCNQKRNKLPHVKAIKRDHAFIDSYKKKIRTITCQEKNRCVFIECEHHMSVCYPQIFNDYTPINDVVDFLTDPEKMPYTCIGHFFQDYPNGATCREVGEILGITGQAVNLVENRAKEKIARRHPKLEDELIPEPIVNHGHTVTATLGRQKHFSERPLMCGPTGGVLPWEKTTLYGDGNDLQYTNQDELDNVIFFEESDQVHEQGK